MYMHANSNQVVVFKYMQFILIYFYLTKIFFKKIFDLLHRYGNFLMEIGIVLVSLTHIQQIYLWKLVVS